MTKEYFETARLRAMLLGGASALAMGVLVAGMAPAAYAQPSDDQTAEETDEDETKEEDKIVVTGSRIRRDEFTSASPIQVIDGEEARAAGLIDTTELLQQSTVAQGAQIDSGLSTVSGALTTSGPGSASISLRGLANPVTGRTRTLVLVNGRRLAPAGVEGAPSNPDTNLIPGSLIERVEILLDGASSVYGSDAIAGVTNIILRSDFEGLELDAFLSVPEIGAGESQTYTATWGISNDRGFMGFAAEYTDTAAINTSDRDWLPRPGGTKCELDVEKGPNDELFTGCSATLSGFLAFTSFGNVISTPGESNIGIPGFSSINLPPFNESGFGTGTFAPTNSFPQDEERTYLAPQERYSIYSFGNYSLGLYGDMEAFYEASYGTRSTSVQRFGQSVIDVPTANPFNPFGEDVLVVALNKFRTVTEVDQLRLIGGVRGDLPFLEFGGVGDWTYELSGSYSRSVGFSNRPGLFNELTVANVLNTSFTNSNGVVECDPLGVAPIDSFGVFSPLECVPLNFLSHKFLTTGRFETDAENDHAFADRTSRTKVEQTLFSGYATGVLAALPAGPMSAVVGAEFRVDSLDTQTDFITRSGSALGFFSDVGTIGDRSLLETFFEVEVPVLSGLPLAEDLSFNFAARWTEEENYGANWTYRVQGLYRPVDWFTIRATYGTNFRAPDTGEQFGNGQVGFAPAGIDPCLVPITAINSATNDYDPALDERSATVIANCILAGVDPTSLGLLNPGTPNLAFQNPSTRTGNAGNPDLDPETSRAWTAGFVFQQPFVDAVDVRFAATYFNYSLQDQVTPLSSSNIVGTCYASNNLSSQTCGLITRDPNSGFITFINANSVNLGEVTSVGFDLNAEVSHEINYISGVDPIFVRLSGNATRSLENDQDLLGDFDSNLGELGFPRWQANGSVTVAWRDFSFFWRTRFLDNMEIDNTPFAGVQCTGCIDKTFIEEYFVSDVSLTYATDTWQIRAGVTNVFDIAPPLVDDSIGGPDNFVNGLGHDGDGRGYFLNVSKRF